MNVKCGYGDARRMWHSRQLVASFFVMPFFPADSAATLDNGTVGAEGLVAIVEGSLAFFVSANVFLTPQGSVDGPRLSTNRFFARAQSAKNVDFWGFFGHLKRRSTG